MYQSINSLSSSLSIPIFQHSPLRTWEGWCRRWKKKAMLGVRRPSGSSGSAGSGKRSGRRRRGSWGPRGNLVMGGSRRCSYPRPPSWNPHARSRTWGAVSLVLLLAFFFFSLFSFLISLVRHTLSWTGLGGGQRGACNVPPLRGQRTGKLDKNIRRHRLARLNASMIKQKKNHLYY